MSALAANVAVALAITLAAVGLLLAGIGFVSWRRSGQGRLAWIALGMAGLGLQGLWYIRFAVSQRGAIARGDEAFPPLLLLDLVVVGAVYMAVLKR